MERRRVSGRKNVHDFHHSIWAYAALIEPTESLERTAARLDEVDQEVFERA